MAYHHNREVKTMDYDNKKPVKTDLISYSKVGESLDQLAKLIGRYDGFPLSTVKDVRNAIVYGTEHKLKLWVTNPEKYKREVLKMVSEKPKTEEKPKRVIHKRPQFNYL